MQQSAETTADQEAPPPSVPLRVELGLAQWSMAHGIIHPVPEVPRS